MIAASAVNLLGNLALHRFALRIGRNFYVDLFAEYLRRDYLEHVRRGSLVLFNNITYEAPRVVTGIVAGGLTLIANLCICALMFAAIVVLSPAAALAAAGLSAAPISPSTCLPGAAWRATVSSRSRSWDGRARTLTQGLGAIREILLRGNQPFFRDAFARDCDALMRISASTFAISQAPRLRSNARWPRAWSRSRSGPAPRVAARRGWRSSVSWHSRRTASRPRCSRHSLRWRASARIALRWRESSTTWSVPAARKRAPRWLPPGQVTNASGCAASCVPAV